MPGHIILQRDKNDRFQLCITAGDSATIGRSELYKAPRRANHGIAPMTCNAVATIPRDQTGREATA